jgi:hypothetical protein
MFGVIFNKKCVALQTEEKLQVIQNSNFLENGSVFN